MKREKVSKQDKLSKQDKAAAREKAAKRKRIASRPALTGDGLRAEAVALVRAQPGIWTLSSLSQEIGRRHGLRPNLVRDLLERRPELRRPPAPPRPPGAQVPATPRRSAPQSWDRLVEDVTMWLSEADTDSIAVEATPGVTGRLHLRYDFVRTGFGLQVWLTSMARSPKVLQACLGCGPWTLTAPGQLPLVGAPAELDAPAVLVWRHAGAGPAAATLRQVLDQALGVAANQVRIERQQCTPVELERRLSDDATVRRLSKRTGRSRAAVSQCDRCGQPLSGPVSVQLGIGPECRRHYSKEVLRRLLKPSAGATRPGSVKEKEWLVRTESWFHDRDDA